MVNCYSAKMKPYMKPYMNHRVINYIPVYETFINNTFKYEIYKIAKEIAIIRFLKILEK